MWCVLRSRNGCIGVSQQCWSILDRNVKYLSYSWPPKKVKIRKKIEAVCEKKRLHWSISFQRKEIWRFGDATFDLHSEGHRANPAMGRLVFSFQNMQTPEDRLTICGQTEALNDVISGRNMEVLAVNMVHHRKAKYSTEHSGSGHQRLYEGNVSLWNWTWSKFSGLS